MKSLIVVHSYHHKNTEKVAKEMADELDAKLECVSNARAESLQDFDLVGFGAGIAAGRHYAPLLKFAKSLPESDGKKAFIFSTSGMINKNSIPFNHSKLRKILVEKGYEIVDEFACKGFDTFAVLKIFGGLNKGHPNAEDFQAAREFSQNLKALVLKESN